MVSQQTQTNSRWCLDNRSKWVVADHLIVCPSSLRSTNLVSLRTSVRLSRLTLEMKLANLKNKWCLNKMLSPSNSKISSTRLQAHFRKNRRLNKSYRMWDERSQQMIGHYPIVAIEAALKDSITSISSHSNRCTPRTIVIWCLKICKKFQSNSFNSTTSSHHKWSHQAASTKTLWPTIKCAIQGMVHS